MIFRGQPGFEVLLEGELQDRGFTLLEEAGKGWRCGESPKGQIPEDMCFPHQILCISDEIKGNSVNELANNLLQWFLADSKQKRFDAEWGCYFEASAGLDGLGRRVNGVERAFMEALKKRMGRVARLASDQKPSGCVIQEGLYVFFVDFDRAYVCTRFLFNGQRRMADDDLAPSRSYLKVEEAYLLLGKEPAQGETVVDLGAAPGGWSYSAAKRGAEVIAVDNGPLKGGAMDHTQIKHLTEDAFGFRPKDDEVFDWMFCDLVEEPHHVLENLISPWLEQGWCRNFVVILKFGRVDPLALLEQVQSPSSLFSRTAKNFKVRHLYHNREEFTIVGSL